MKGPFKLRSGNSPLFKQMGSSPIEKVELMDSKGEGWETSPTPPKMKDLAIGSEARIAEYERRGWAHDETTTGYAKPKKAATSVAVEEDVKVDKDIQSAGIDAAKTIKYDTSKTAREKHYDAMSAKEQEALSTSKSRKKSKQILKEQYKKGSISEEAYKAGKKKIRKAARKDFFGKIGKFLKGDIDTQYRGKSAKEKIAERKKKKGY